LNWVPDLIFRLQFKRQVIIYLREDFRLLIDLADAPARWEVAVRSIGQLELAAFQLRLLQVINSSILGIMYIHHPGRLNVDALALRFTVFQSEPLLVVDASGEHVMLAPVPATLGAQFSSDEQAVVLHIGDTPVFHLLEPVRRQGCLALRPLFEIVVH